MVGQDGSSTEDASAGLAPFLRARSGEILDAWKAVAARSAAGRSLDDLELLDHVPMLLARVAEIADAAARGCEPAPPVAEADQHALDRLRAGFDLAEVVREYTQLRQVIVERWLAERGPSPLRLLHESLDAAIAAAVHRYTEARDRTVRAIDRVAAAALDATDLNVLLERLLRVFAEAVASVDAAVLFVRDERHVAAAAGIGVELPPCESLTRDSAEAALRRAGMRAVSVAPIDAHEVRGFVVIGSRANEVFSREDQELLHAMTARSAAAVQLHWLRDEARARAQLVSRLEQLISAHPDFFYLLDRHHRFTYVSPALLALWGRTPDQALGRTFEELEYPERLVRLHAEEIHRVLAGETVRGDNAYTSPDGREGHYEYIVAPLRSADGSIDAVGGVTRDITARREQELELRDAAELRERLVAMLGHDLRSPVSAIHAASLLLLRGGALAEPQARAVSRILAASERMGRMIGDVVDYAQSHHGGLRLRRQRVDLAEVCSAVLDEIALSYPDRTLVLEQACPCEGEWDRDRIAQVATNLIVNAVKHGAADRPITVRVGIEGDEAHLEVHNDGPAIPPGRLATIFEPFTTASKPALDSLGLGLTIVREIVSAHGGHVDVSSSDEQGTTFRIGLPVRGGSAPG